jgi:hypothetical protein
MASVANQRAAGSATGTIYLVEEGPNPSTDYFLMPALKPLARPIVRCSWTSPLPTAQALAGATVIFVRYVPTAWKHLVNQTHRSPPELVYFMDDDLWDYRAAAGLSLKYRFKLARYATRHRRWLESLNSKLWVSTKWLADKYAAQQPKLVMPALLEAAGSLAASASTVNTSPSSPTSGAPSAATRAIPLTATSITAATQNIQLFYHGSASHRADIEWLHPVIKTVLARNPRLQFEIIGDAHTRALYASLEPCTVLAPMKWPAYRTLIATPGRHIGLAPAVPHPFNRARSHTKFFDITLAGAVGIYAAQGPCQGILEHNKHGLLVGMTPEAWVEAILQLADDLTLRQALYTQALEHADALSKR